MKLKIATTLAALLLAQNSLSANEKTLLNDVTVTTASGFEQNIKDAPATINVITKEELLEKRYTNLAQALDGVEGIDIGSSNGKTGGREISMRGLGSDYTLVLIDGKRQNTTSNATPNGFGTTSTSFMPPLSSIERIEVIKGPMSTLYGSDAMGGVINIITKKVSNEWSGSITVDNTFQEDRDFGDSRSGSLYLSGPLVKDLLGLQLRGSLLKRDASDLEPTGDAGTSIISKRGASPVKSTIENFGARLSFTPHDNHDLYVDFDTTKQKYDNSENQLGNGLSSGYGKELQFNKEQLSVSHTGRFELMTLETSLTETTTEKKGRFVVGTGTTKDGTPRQIENTNLVFDTKAVIPFENAKLSIGGQYIDAVMIEGIASEDFEQQTKSIFAENEWMMTDDLALTLGARYDNHSAFGGNTSPRAYLVYNANENWIFKGGVSTGYKTPSLNDLHDGLTGISGQGTKPTIGSPELEPEKSVSKEVGAYYDSQEGMTFNVTLFQNDFKDKISNGDALANCEFASNPNQAGCYSLGAGTFTNTAEFSQKTNIDTAETRGIELASTFELPYNMDLKLNYTYTDSETKTQAGQTGKLTDTPEHMFNANLGYKPTKDLKVWLKAEFRGDRRRFTDDYQYLTADEKAQFNQLGDYKGYTLFHLGSSYKVNKNLTFSGTVYNLLDEDFLKYKSYKDSSGVTNYSNVYNLHEEGRRLWVSANYTF